MGKQIKKKYSVTGNQEVLDEIPVSVKTHQFIISLQMLSVTFENLLSSFLPSCQRGLSASTSLVNDAVICRKGYSCMNHKSPPNTVDKRDLFTRSHSHSLTLLHTHNKDSIVSLRQNYTVILFHTKPLSTHNPPKH